MLAIDYSIQLLLLIAGIKVDDQQPEWGTRYDVLFYLCRHCPPLALKDFNAASSVIYINYLYTIIPCTQWSQQWIMSPIQRETRVISYVQTVEPSFHPQMVLDYVSS
jgi:hypothetical protein